jgi:hypothetical protein
VDDGDIAHEADVHVLGRRIPDRDRPRRLFEEHRAVGERPVRMAAQEIAARISSKRATSGFCTEAM